MGKQRIIQPGMRGDESLAAFRALYPDKYGLDDYVRVQASRREELAFAFGFYTAKGWQDRIDECRHQMAQIPG